jgi:regulator of cell morphogenesis and NO signaling
MALRGVKRIDQNLLVSDIVNNDYRAADVFRRYGIDFCCGGKWPLKVVCDSRDLDIATIKKELEEAVRTIHLPNTLNFDQWDIDFLSDYIVNVHHSIYRRPCLKQENISSILRKAIRKNILISPIF